MERDLNKYGILNSLISILNEGMDDLADVTIAKYLLQNYNRLQDLNIYNVASECFVSRTTILRFAKKLGFDNFKDLKSQFSNFYDTYLFYRSSIYGNRTGISCVEEISNMARECELFFTKERVASIVEDIHRATQIVFMTSDIYSRQSAEFQKAMILNGKMVRVISNKYENNEILDNLKQEDLLLVISVSGFFVTEIMPFIKENCAKKILLTTIHDKSYNKIFNEIWYLSETPKRGNRNVYTVFATQYCLEKIFDAYLKSLK